MAGKVLQFEKAINPDTMARELAGMYNQWWIQRQNKETEWRELRNYLFATDTTTTSNSSLPWKNKTTLPKLTLVSDTEPTIALPLSLSASSSYAITTLSLLLS